MSGRPRNLVEKIWEAHVVAPGPDGTDLLYVDVHLLHEVTSPQAFAALHERGLSVRRPDRCFATMDHSTPTRAGAEPSPESRAQLDALAEACTRHGIRLWPAGDPGQGIVHVIGPEKGLSLPGRTLVCGDSHTSTHGAWGALAFGIGTTEVSHVLATQCLLRGRPRTLNVEVTGERPRATSAKDLALFLCARLGTDGGRGSVIEFTGAAVRALSMEERMTLCNMAIEMGARAGLVGPDERTFEAARGLEYAPRGRDFDRAVERWRRLPSDPAATWDERVRFDAAEVEPWVTWGTNPAMGGPLSARIPALDSADEPVRRAADAMGWLGGEAVAGRLVDVVFVGSCTNARLGDLRDAAAVLRGRRVSDRVRMLVVPGSRQVQREAESEGLDDVFRTAGAEWREPGCSMCIAMNGDRLQPGQLAVSTSNRNFEGRQGPGGRTVLAAPRTAAAAAVLGRIPRAAELELAEVES